MTVHFDTLDYANTLERAGIERAEAIAKVQAQALKDRVDDELVTKGHLNSELAKLETRLSGRIDMADTKLAGRPRRSKQGSLVESRRSKRNSRRSFEKRRTS